MADRSIKVILRAQVDDFKRQMDDAAKSTRKVGEDADKSSGTATTALGRMSRSAQDNREAWDRSGTALTAFGAATVAALGFATAAAVQWESAWTGVTKTVDGSASEMAQLEDDLRKLARTLPATHTEIAAVAEAAGQLGVAREDVASFTKTMIDLSETTNLTADEAATSIAQLMNVMQTAPEDVDNLGAALVALGNDGASTERDIVQMAQRIAGSGKIIGLTEGEVMGLANALASVGIEVEAGGSAISNIMIDISKSVSSGSDDLESWAAVAGMSAKDFAAAWKSDPAEALTMTIEGLGRMNAAGGDVFATLTSLGQSDVRVTRALLSMANSGDLLRESLALGNAAWAENTALIAEAEKRYDTTEAKLQIARNAIADAAITLGETFLPAIAGASEAVAAFAGWIGALPAPIQSSVAVIGGLVGVTALAAGGFLLLFPRVLETVKAFRTLKADGSKVPGVMSAVGKAAAVASAALVAVQVAAAVFGQESKPATAAEWANRLLDVKTSADLAKVSLGGIAGETYTLSDALKRVTAPGVIDAFDDWSGNLLSMNSSADLLTDEFESMGNALATLYASDPVRAAQTFDAILAQTGGTTEQLLDVMPAYRDALLNADTAQEVAGTSAEELAESLGYTGQMTEEAAEALKKWRDMASAADKEFITLNGAYDSVIQKNKDYAQSTADATDSSTDSWEDYYDGVSVSAEDYIADLQKQVDAQAAWETNMLDITRRVKEGMTGDMADAANAMIDELLELGPEGAAQVQLLRDMSDAEFAQVVSLWSNKGATAVSEFVSQVEGYRQPVVTVNADLSPAQRALETFIYNAGIRQVRVGVSSPSALAAAGVPGFDSGGPVFGPGSTTSDSILARLSNQEHVWSALEVKGAGGHAAVAGLRAAARTGSLPGFASGGSPAYAQSASSLMPARVSFAAPAQSVREGPLVHVEQVVQGTPQDVGREVAWAMAGKVLP